MPSNLAILLTLSLIAIALSIYRLLTILSPTRPRPVRHGKRNSDDPTHLLIVLGSGGHTAEMLAMLTRAVKEQDLSRRLDWRDYTHRTWVVGAGDSISAQRAREFEEMAVGLGLDGVESAEDIDAGSSVIVTVPRAREIHQPLLTAPISCLRCMLACAIMLMQHAGNRGWPDIILCNGPATATMLVVTSVLLRFFNLDGCHSDGKMRTVYVESWARVKKVSLSGRVLGRIVDRFLVQWPQLETAVGGKAQYLGVLV